DSAAAELLRLMRQRLLLMHEVARWKWNHDRPVADEQREQELLADVEERAERSGFDAGRARALMAAQIDAGKLIQEANFTRWREQGRGKFADVRDLHTDLRPAIDQLTTDLLACFGRLSPQFGDDEARAVLQQRALAIVTGE